MFPCCFKSYDSLQHAGKGTYLKKFEGLYDEKTNETMKARISLRNTEK